MTWVIDREGRVCTPVPEQVSRSCVDSSEHVLQLTKAFPNAGITANPEN